MEAQVDDRILVGVAGAAVALVVMFWVRWPRRRLKLWAIWFQYAQQLHGEVHGGIVEMCPKAACREFVLLLEKVVGAKTIDAVRRATPRGWFLRKRERAGNAVAVIRPLPTKVKASTLPGAAEFRVPPTVQLDIERALRDKGYYQEHRPYFLGFCQKVGVAERRAQNAEQIN